MIDVEHKSDIPTKAPYEILLRKISVGILVLGLAASAVVYEMAPLDVESDNSNIYVASINNSKKARLELERIGGKAAVVAVEFNDWFDSLWHGRKLAGTLAVLSIGASLLCFLVGKIPPLDDNPSDKNVS
jgi:hypothetical protein